MTAGKISGGWDGARRRPPAAGEAEAAAAGLIGFSRRPTNPWSWPTRGRNARRRVRDDTGTIPSRRKGIGAGPRKISGGRLPNPKLVDQLDALTTGTRVDHRARSWLS